MRAGRTGSIVVALALAAAEAALVQCGSVPPGPAPGPPSPEAPASTGSPGRVVSAAAGDGVLGARLVRSRTGRPIPGTLTVTGPGGFVRAASAGSDGWAVVNGLPHRVRLDAVAESPGLLPCSIRGIRIPAFRDEWLWDLPLGGPSSVAVRVEDEEESPVPGATVEVRASSRWDGIPAPPPTLATTGDDGRCVLAGVPPGEWQVVTRARGRGTHSYSLSIVEGALRNPLQIILGEAHGLEGRILDPDGKPAAGTEVTVLLDNSGEVAATTTADAEGRFRVEDLPGRRIGIAVRLRSGVLEFLDWVELAGAAPCELRLFPRGEIRGRVLDDATGLPVAGAEVTVNGGWIGRADPAVSGADGTFIVPDVPLVTSPRPGSEGCLVDGIWVERAGYLPWWIPRRESGEPAAPCVVPAGTAPSEESLLQVRLRKGVTVLHGVIRTSDGKPVPGAWVSLKIGDPGGDWSTLNASTDGEGRYRLPPAPPGPALLSAGAYMLHLEGTGRGAVGEPSPTRRSIVLPPSGESEMDLALVPDSVMEGRMVLGDGCPAVGYIPVLTNYRGGGGGRGAPSAEDGSFRIEELMPAEGVSVEAEGPEGTMGVSAPFDILESAKVEGILVHVVLPASVSGRIVGPDGSPVADSYVRFSFRKPGTRPSARVEGHVFGDSYRDATVDGTFRAERLSAGIWVPVARAPGYLGVVGEPLVLAEGEAREGLVLTLREGRSVSGRVLDGAGNPVAGASVGAFPTPKPQPWSPSLILKSIGPGDAAQRAESGADGTFRITGLEDSPYDVAAWKEGLLGSLARAKAGDEGVVLRVGAKSAVSGVVLDPSGGSVEGARVAVDSSGRESWGGLSPLLWGWILGTDALEPATSGPGGAFRLDAPEGECRVVATKEGLARGVAVARAPAEGVRVRLRPEMAISGRVVGPDGAPAADAWVDAISRDGDEEGGETWSGEDGAFAVRRLAPGPYLLRARHPEANLVPALEDAVADAGATGVVVRTREGFRFRARFVLPGGGAPSGEDHSVLVEEVLEDGTCTFDWARLEGGVLDLSGLGKCTLRVYYTCEGEELDLENPAPGTLFGPFEVPGPERTIPVER